MLLGTAREQKDQRWELRSIAGEGPGSECEAAAVWSLHSDGRTVEADQLFDQLQLIELGAEPLKAHSGKTGNPNLTANRCSAKAAESSYSTVRLASEFDPNLVSKSAWERRTTCRTGRFCPGIWSDDR